ncbi:hypothetical protein ACWGLF_46560 [Streptomyces puniciscabiei]
MIRTIVCRCFAGASKSSRSICSMKPFTGSSTLGRGGGDFRFGGTGDSSACRTVRRDTLNLNANSRPDSPCSQQACRIFSYNTSRDLCTIGLPDLDRDQQAKRDGQTTHNHPLHRKWHVTHHHTKVEPDPTAKPLAPKTTGNVAPNHPEELSLGELVGGSTRVTARLPGDVAPAVAGGGRELGYDLRVVLEVVQQLHDPPRRRDRRADLITDDRFPAASP